MKKLLAIISLFALVLASCEKEEIIPAGSNLDTLTATIESAAGTKATLQDGTNNNVVVWESFDAISVFVQKGNTVSNVKYVLNSGKGTAQGVFGKADSNFDMSGATVLAAVYPYTEGAAYSNGTISGLSTSNEYAYSSIEKVGPMAAKATGASLTFKNIGALVKVTTNDIPNGYTSVELSSATSNLSGSFTVTLDANGMPTASLTGTDKSIVFTGTGAGQTIYFPILAGTYSDLTVKAKGQGNADITLIAPKALTAVRSTIHSISANVISSNTVTLSATDNKNIAINTNEASITVQEENGVGITGNVNIAIEGGSINRTLDVKLPGATVELTGDATYDQITATTAENTLILGNGVTATTVVVKKGNIQVNAGATLNGVSFGTEEGDITSVIVIDNGGTIDGTVNSISGVTVMPYAEYELRKAIAAGGTVTLSSDVQLTLPIIITNEVTVDLNDKTLTAGTFAENSGVITAGTSDSYVFWVQSGGNLTVKGTGKVVAVDATYSIAVWADGGTVNIEGGEYSNGGDACDLIYAKKNGVVNISGGTFTATHNSGTVAGTRNEYSALNLHGTYPGTITVTGGKFYKFNPAYNVSENPQQNFVAAGYSSVANGDYYEVKEGIYNELALRTAIVDDAEVTLSDNIELSDYIEIRDIKVIINLNNHTITHPATSGATYMDVFEVYGNGNLTIEGDGEIVAEDGYCIYATGNSTVVLNGGYYFSPVTTVDVRKNAVATINGGEFKVDGADNPDGDYGQKFTLNLRDKINSYASEQSDIIVKGGKFWKYNPAASESEPEITNFVAEGYTSEQEGDYYVVSKIN